MNFVGLSLAVARVAPTVPRMRRLTITAAVAAVALAAAPAADAQRLPPTSVDCALGWAEHATETPPWQWACASRTEARPDLSQYDPLFCEVQRIVIENTTVSDHPMPYDCLTFPQP